MKDASYDLTKVADQDLLSNLEVLLCRERGTLAEVLAHIGEIDRRRLFAKHACSSLFEYCLSRLQMSEAAAGKRITAARLAHRFKSIVPMVARGELHLTGLNVLATHLTDENHKQLLDASRHQSKRAIEQIVADLFPKPSVPSRIRKLPSKAPPLPTDTTQLCLAANNEANNEANHNKTAGRHETMVVREAVGSPVPRPPARRSSTQPLGTDRFKVEFTADKDLRDKLQQAQELLRHAEPDGDLAAIIERGIDLLLLEIKAKRFGISKRSQIKAANDTRSMTQKSSGASKTRRGEKPSTHRSGIESDAKRSRSIPRNVRRQVYERDEGRCTYRDADGHRYSGTCYDP